jgi:hypothetical protein
MFDPQQHQAMFEAPLPGTKAGQIIQVMTEGFMLHDRLLRPAQVGRVVNPRGGLSALPGPLPRIFGEGKAKFESILMGSPWRLPSDVCPDLDRIGRPQPSY